MKDQNMEDQIPQNVNQDELNDERYRHFLKHVHQAMFVFLLAGGVVFGTQFPQKTLYAYCASCLLMWINVTFLVIGIYGALKKRNRTAFLLLGQGLILLGGLFGLIRFFRSELLWVILGCSTWLGALFWAQYMDKIRESSSEKT